MNIPKLDLLNCTGCSLCVVSCLQKAMTMEPDDEGFLTPKVNNSLCTDCGRCVSVCPQNKRLLDGSPQKHKVYACQTLNQNRLIAATAGGLFPTIADWIIAMEGVVYGATYDDNMYVVHRAAHSIDDIEMFSGSKYVQSDIYHALPEIRENLINGKIVLFSGTPCQVDAVKSYCSDINTTQLYTIDVICYGVPSPKLFRTYLDSVENENKAKVIDFRFRDKRSNGWSHTTVITLCNDENSIITIEEPDYYKIPYYRMFGSRNCYRRSCYSCKYNTLNRVSDITTGNFWGIESISEKFDTTLGVSLAIINTPKGENLFLTLKDKMIIEERTVEEAIKANDALINTSKYPKNRDDIYCYFKNKGFNKMIKRYYTKRWYHPIRQILGRLKEKFISIFI